MVSASNLIVFLSMPISDNLAKDGTFRPEKRVFYGKVIEVLEDIGLKVECAALNEDWGNISLPTIEFTAYDLEAISRSDLLVLVTSERLTRDMYLEVGLTLARDLPVLFCIPASAHVTFMIQGLEEMGKIQTVKYDSEADVPELLRASLLPILEELKNV